MNKLKQLILEEVKKINEQSAPNVDGLSFSYIKIAFDDLKSNYLKLKEQYE